MPVRLLTMVVILGAAACSGDVSDTSKVERVETVELLEDGTTETTVTVKTSGRAALPTSAVGEFRVSNLPAFFDCVRETDGLLIASHRA